MPFNIKKRGKLTYYYEGDDLRICFSGLTGGYYATAYRNFINEHCLNNGVPAPFTVHVVDVPDQAASYEFYATTLYQQSMQS